MPARLRDTLQDLALGAILIVLLIYMLAFSEKLAATNLAVSFACLAIAVIALGVFVLRLCRIVRRMYRWVSGQRLSV